MERAQVIQDDDSDSRAIDALVLAYDTEPSYLGSSLEAQLDDAIENISSTGVVDEDMDAVSVPPDIPLAPSQTPIITTLNPTYWHTHDPEPLSAAWENLYPIRPSDIPPPNPDTRAEYLLREAAHHFYGGVRGGDVSRRDGKGKVKALKAPGKSGVRKGDGVGREVDGAGRREGDGRGRVVWEVKDEDGKEGGEKKDGDAKGKLRSVVKGLFRR